MAAVLDTAPGADVQCSCSSAARSWDLHASCGLAIFRATFVPFAAARLLPRRSQQID